MRHCEPRIQELVCQVQGALELAGCPARDITWESEPVDFDGWTLIITLRGVYRMQFSVAGLVLREQRWWDSLKWQLTRCALETLLKDSRPAPDRAVTWKVAPWIEPPEVMHAARNAEWFVNDTASKEDKG